MWSDFEGILRNFAESEVEHSEGEATLTSCRTWQLNSASDPRQLAVQWQDCLEGVLRDIPEVLAKRSAEKERETLRARQAWQQAAAGVMLALMSGAGISACKCLPHASGTPCEPG